MALPSPRDGMLPHVYMHAVSSIVAVMARLLNCDGLV